MFLHEFIHFFLITVAGRIFGVLIVLYDKTSKPKVTVRIIFHKCVSELELMSSETQTPPLYEAVAVSALVAVLLLLCLLCDDCHNMMTIMSGGSAYIDLSILQMASFLWTQHHISLLHQLLDV